MKKFIEVIFLAMALVMSLVAMQANRFDWAVCFLLFIVIIKLVDINNTLQSTIAQKAKHD